MAQAVIEVEPAKRSAVLARAYLAAAMEAARGVLSEVEAERPTNAIRLARHVYEYDLLLDYVLDRPGQRLLQLRADDAHRHLLAESLVPGLTLRRRTRRAFQEVVDASEAAARRRGWIKGRTEQGPRLPSMVRMAEVLESRRPGRKEEYDLVYRGASVLSHPSLLGADTYLVSNADGTVAIRSSSEDPIREVQALVMACRAFIDILDTTNWQLLAPLGAEIRALLERAMSA